MFQYIYILSGTGYTYFPKRFDFVLQNSAGPDGMMKCHIMGLHCLSKYLFRGFCFYKGLLLSRGADKELTLRFFTYSQTCLSYDVASESKITPCNKIDKPLVVY